MTDIHAYIGEIRLLAGDNPPKEWLPCDGRLLPIQGNETLYALVLETYGGDGERFGLPDLRGRVPVHHSAQVPLGQFGGVEQVTLEPDTLPPHTHSLQVSNALGAQPTGEGNVLAQAGTVALYSSSPPDVSLLPMALTQTEGPGGRPHENMPPYVAVGMYVICVDGMIPERPGEAEE